MTTTQNTTIVLTGRYRGHGPGALLILPEAEAKVVLLSAVGKTLEDAIVEVAPGKFEANFCGKVRRFKSSGGALRALKKAAVYAVASEEAEAELKAELEELEE